MASNQFGSFERPDEDVANQFPGKQSRQQR
jgi:hypothetical protein